MSGALTTTRSYSLTRSSRLADEALFLISITSKRLSGRTFLTVILNCSDDDTISTEYLLSVLSFIPAPFDDYRHPTTDHQVYLFAILRNVLVYDSFRQYFSDKLSKINDHDKNTLHGGFVGTDHLVWDVKEVCDTAIVLTLELPDGQEGFPGNRQVYLKYTVSGSDFTVFIQVNTDLPTPVTFTHHPFFCLRGQGVDTVEPYWMQIFASHYIPVDDLSIPTGEIAPVEGTPFDFREPHQLGERIGPGYDHNWCLDAGGGVQMACRMWDPLTGRCIEVLTDQPGLQVYSGNFFDGSENGSNGKPLGFRSSVALETQYWPDAVNQPSFPSCILRPGETYNSTTVYRFTITQ